MTIEKLSYSIPDAATATSYSRSFLYRLIKEGRLSTYKRGGRIFILAENLKNMIEEDAKNGAAS
ncbi:MAG: helix-turn-helix domain-containing protein [Candidatus Thiodiazotropha sp.]|nr:helix-turn-helix domain-containing protein [Candidatus Thiodiazotropha sp.]MCM8885456.1 helix-turn-helix domain-containing protein [Candidatus Thiodiazotropha sp.]MCM8920708.1 helix-turn-helix domain-containing protein [Candidatus Thiodiazotropha sp.]